MSPRNKFSLSSLQTRVSLTLFVFAVAVALLVSSVGSYINERIEMAIWSETLNSELDFRLQREDAEQIPSGSLRESLTLFVYDDKRPERGGVPSWLVGLTPGLHDEFEVGGKQYCVLVRDVEHRRYFLTYDITELEDAEASWVAASIVAISAILLLVLLLSIQLGRWLVAPIEQLSSQVTQLDPNKLPQALSFQFSHKEVKAIADALNKFITTLRSFIKRERAFVSLASHEFRTPIAVVSGAVDVLSSLDGMPESSKKPLLRISRSVDEMRQMVSALLFLAKDGRLESEFEDTECEVASLLPSVVEAHQHLLRGKQLEFRLTQLDPFVVPAPSALVRVAIANLVRNAIQHGSSGTVELALCEGVLRVADTGKGFTKTPGADAHTDFSEGNGLGLYIVGRIATHFGWRLRFVENQPHGTIAMLDFASDSEQILPTNESKQANA